MPVERYVSQEAFAGRYLVQAAAQVCIDLANHLISSEGWRVPSDFRDAFTVLEASPRWKGGGPPKAARPCGSPGA